MLSAHFSCSLILGLLAINLIISEAVDEWIKDDNFDMIR